MRKTFFVLFFCFISIAFAQTTLEPAETTFTIGTIILEPLPSGEDFTGWVGVPMEYRGIALTGDLNYLKIKWNARYIGEEKDIGVLCYLNCPNPSPPIQESCEGYQNCSYLGPTGKRLCAIEKPEYHFTQINNVTCKFYDPSNPSIEFLPYPNRTFYSIKFDLGAEPATIIVGETFSLQINVKSLGLLISSFTVNLSLMPSPFNPPLIIENPLTKTEDLGYAQIGSVFPKVTFLASGKANFEIYSKSNIEPVENFDVSCSRKEDCKFFDLGYGYDCIESRCWARYELEINSGKKSLPGLNFLSIIQILLIAIIILKITYKF